MLERKPTGQEGPEPPETPGDEDLAGAFDDGAQTGSHDVIKTGFDTDLPDDADDVQGGAAAPIPSPRVGADEKVVLDKVRRPRRAGPGGVRRSAPRR
jgi:hypothetical protein